MSWPSEKIVATAYSGRAAQIIRTPLGNGKGVRSSDRWVYLIVGPKSFVFCERCGGSTMAPDAPAGSTGPGEAPRPLMAPGTKGHALFTLTWLHRFSATHENCKEPVVERNP